MRNDVEMRQRKSFEKDAHENKKNKMRRIVSFQYDEKNEDKLEERKSATSCHSEPAHHMTSYPSTEIKTSENSSDSHHSPRVIINTGSVSKASSIRHTPVSDVHVIEEHEYLTDEYEFVGYEVIDPRKKCFIFPPRPSMMNTRGWAGWAITTLFFWPLSILPCILSSSYDPYQRPVYRRITI